MLGATAHAMTDFIAIAAIVGFFGICLAVVRGLDHL